MLYHSRAELERRWEEAKAATTPNEDLIFDLAAALDFVKTSFGGELVTIDALLENGEITFEYLWALYRPCEPVFHIDGLGEPRVYIAKSHRTVKEPNGKFYYEILGETTRSLLPLFMFTPVSKFLCNPKMSHTPPSPPRVGADSFFDRRLS